MQNKKKIITWANLRFSGSCGISSFSDWFRIWLNMICLNLLIFLYNCTYMNFRINLTQFYINFSRQEHQIAVLYVLFNAWDSQVSFYTPFHFSFTVPLIYPLSFFFYSPCNEVQKIKTREATRSQGRTIKFDHYSFYLFHSGETFVSVKMTKKSVFSI